MPDGNSNVDATILKLAEQYQSTLVRSRELNDERATIRENVDKLGIDPKAFQVGLMMARDFTPGERTDYTSSLTRTLSALDGKEADLFGADEIAARDKRAQRRADKAAGSPTPKAKADAKSDANPKSDPKRGGAGRKRGAGGGGTTTEGDGTAPDDRPPATTLKEANKQSEAAIKESLAQVQAREQTEGAGVLNSVGTAPVDKVVDGGGETTAPISQSAKSAEALERAKLN